MIICDDIRERLSLYIDGELEEEEKKNIEKHINNCDKCNKEYNELIRCKDLLNTLGEEELPDKFASSLHEKLLIEKKVYDAKNNKFYTFIKVFSGIAAAILVVFIIKNSAIFDMKNEDFSEKTNISEDDRSVAVLDENADGFKESLEEGAGDSQKNGMKRFEPTPEIYRDKNSFDFTKTNLPIEDLEAINNILKRENIELQIDPPDVNSESNKSNSVSFNTEKEEVEPIVEKIQENVNSEIDIKTSTVNYSTEIMQLEYELNVINEKLKELTSLENSNYDDEIEQLKKETKEIQNKIEKLEEEEEKINVQIILVEQN